jgi:hypothetical protein
MTVYRRANRVDFWPKGSELRAKHLPETKTNSISQLRAITDCMHSFWLVIDIKREISYCDVATDTHRCSCPWKLKV